MNSNYIAFEGIDGSGKTSIIENLSDILNSQNKEHIIVREPGGTSVGEGIRELLLSHDYQVNPLAEALLMSASRAQLIQETVKPSLDNGQIVITDRSAYSSVAYQGVGRELGYKKIYELNDLAIESIWPKKVVLLDIDPKVSLSRQKIVDRIGSGEIEFFQKVRSGYLQLAKEFENDFLVLNAENNIDLNVEAICGWLEIDNTK
ncbi:MAG: dTMP kinase [Actinobacteria bacterium]|mgnify:FL=1|nr:dTMP kinase [Actinomycetota bacterium]|tara:strand:- start:494 stop:1105 length:612 start_codon:yes stop_codon:yes gene_type:complete